MAPKKNKTAPKKGTRKRKNKTKNMTPSVTIPE
jgi:hypothetical protein